jgi:hypothetical protein
MKNATLFCMHLKKNSGDILNLLSFSAFLKITQKNLKKMYEERQTVEEKKSNT